MAVVLRPVQGTDMDAMFGMLSDPDSRQMAPFVAIDFDTRAEFDARIAQLSADPSIKLYSMLAGGHFVGAIMTFDGPAGREVFYWIRRIAWGRGLATEAMARILNLDHTRPIYAHVLSTNPRALAVLNNCGFAEVSRRDAIETPAPDDEDILLVKN
ncbi:MAG: GNAT family N-acetyltransferase [Propionibacteriaceae bacterium]|jgi:RimJ/RimL family protein N-acetyltransferase|nr:GNAT family N-acetyltransferase [Propionibacteriaceae bacterium]